MMHVDVAKFAQIVRNLVSNALKFTPRDGNVTILLEVVRE
jgi:signal transduction histidine kinase